MALRLLTLAALAPALTLAVGAATAGTDIQPTGPTIGDRVGISTSTVWLPPAQGYAYLRRARDIGIGWVREGFNWNSIERARGSFSWGWTDALMTNAARLGMHVLAVVTYAPSWASGYSDRGEITAQGRDRLRTVRESSCQPLRKERRVLAIPSPARPDSDHGDRALERALALAILGARSRRSRLHSARQGGGDWVKITRPGMRLLASADVPEESAGVGKDWFVSALRADPALWRSNLVNAWSVHLYCHELSPADTTATPRSQVRPTAPDPHDLAAHQALADKPIWAPRLGSKIAPASSTRQRGSAGRVHARGPGEAERRLSGRSSSGRLHLIPGHDPPRRRIQPRAARQNGSPRLGRAASYLATAT